MTYEEIYEEFCKKFPNAEVEDYRPAVEMHIPQLARGIPNAIIVWLKDGSEIIYIAKKSEVEVMNLNEAIKHAEEVAEEKEAKVWFDDGNEKIENSCVACAEEHRQLAEWLKDYKRLLEQESVLDKIRVEIKEVYNDRPHNYNHSQRTELFCEVIKIIDKYHKGGIENDDKRTNK